MDSETARWRVGELAQRCGISVDTVRFYQKRGLLKKVDATGDVNDVYARFKQAVGLN